jgi:hypothetical protein
VDTDGADYDVLLGADDLLRNGRVLGLAVEAQFHGPVGPDANLFSNIDGYLRARGFSLFELEVYRYSRGALPAPFQLEIPAQTVTGQVSWGEAIYLRDLGDEAYERMWGFEPSRVDLYKLISMFEIFGLVDCAAELVLKYGPHLGSETDCAAFLDVLAGEQSGTGMSYAALQREFAEDARRRFSGGHS